MFGHNGNINRSTNDMKNKLRYLKSYVTSIITKLRMYKFKWLQEFSI